MPFSHRDYTVACICPMGVELAPIKAMLDKLHPSLPTQRDQNSYTLGEIEGHNIVIAVLPEIGTNSAATVAIQLLNDFSSIGFGLLVGIGGGVPDEEEDGNDIRLGDVVVSKPTAGFGGVVQYDLGKYSTIGGFERTGALAKPPPILRSSVETLAADHRMKGSKVPQYLSNMLQHFPTMEEEYSRPDSLHPDLLFKADYPHPGGRNCQSCDKGKSLERDDRPNKNPKFHYGTIGSANTVVKDAVLREELRKALKIICVEMEAAGLMDSFPCLVIRGICDYADSHKNKKWQPYAAATAAAYMKELLSVIPPKDVATVSPASDVVQIPKHNLGLNLFDAPDMRDDLFIGRDTELEQMKDILRPDSNSSVRKVLVLGGMGGIGKTQLAITYAKRYSSSYSSAFWLNATSESSLKSSLRDIANRIISPGVVNKLDDDQLRAEVSNWLSELDNTRWLLILDNYDDPDQYDIKKYYTAVAHGSIIITTRQPRRISGEPVGVVSMTDTDDSLAILTTRSGLQDTQSDLGARQLAQRLDGFPLALVTAGAFLKESPVSYSEYLKQYEAKWKVVLDDEELPDYPTRTLYTTWDLSLTQIREQNPQAAKLLSLLAYFDHQDIWYELLHAGRGVHQPLWFNDLISDKFSFENAMRTLTRYCLVQSHHLTKSYSLHVCVHDWTLDGLNHDIDAIQYWTAVDCVASHVSDVELSDLSTLNYHRFSPHAKRLVHERFRQEIKKNALSLERLDKICNVADLMAQQHQHEAAEKLYINVLEEKQRIMGADHVGTTDILNRLGNLYMSQVELDQAMQMYQRALTRRPRALSSGHINDFMILNNLGLAYQKQGQLDHAEQMFIQALARYEKAIGPNHIHTLRIVKNFGLLYADQNKLGEAGQMYQRALAGQERTLTSDHPDTLDTINGLANLFVKSGRFDQADQMYQRVLAARKRVLGPNHLNTLFTTARLGLLRMHQDRLPEAEEMLGQVLTSFEKAFGSDHRHTLEILHDLVCCIRNKIS